VRAERASLESREHGSMFQQLSKFWQSWRPGWVRDWLRTRRLKRTARELDDHYRPFVAEASGDTEQGLVSEWMYQTDWPRNELAEIETSKLVKRAKRWLVEVPEWHDRRSWTQANDSAMGNTFSATPHVYECGKRSGMLAARAFVGGFRPPFSRSSA
jgi:hypothetical protein